MDTAFMCGRRRHGLAAAGPAAHDAIEFVLAHRLPPLEEAYPCEGLLEERAVIMQDWADSSAVG